MDNIMKINLNKHTLTEQASEMKAKDELCRAKTQWVLH